MNCASAMAATLIRETNVPSCGTISTSRSSRSRISASRTGVRLTPRSSASSFSLSRRPGSSVPETIASRSAAYTCVRVLPVDREIVATICILVYQESEAADQPATAPPPVRA